MAEAESNIQKLPITKEIRKSLETRNLYNEFNEYDITNPLVVKAIDYIVDSFSPGNSFNFRDSLAGRVLLPDTKLSQIGTVQLAKQFSIRAFGQTKLNNLPVTNVRNLFDKDPNTRLFTDRLNFKITPMPANGNTIFDQIKNEISGNFPKSPFNKNSTASDYFNTLGNGQQTILQKNLTNTPYNIWFAVSPQPELSLSRLTDNRVFVGGKTPYEYLDLIDNQAQNNNTFTDNVKSHEGINSVVYYDRTSDNSYQVEKGFGLTTNLSSQNKEPIRHDFPDPDDINEFSYVGLSDIEMKDKFGADRGLLYFTNKIIRESEIGTKNNQLSLGRFKTNGKETLRGSLPCRVFTKVKTTNADDLAFYGDGYSKSDHQYRSYGRLIRKDGIRLYNPDATASVIYDSVIPKFSPTALNDNKKYMFSMENLAYNMGSSVTLTENGITSTDFKDEDGTIIPACEVGSNGGRLMWFMPYGIKISESSRVDFNTDQFIGRPEKVYTYNSTDRTLSLSFMLLMDYPAFSDTLQIDQLANFYAGCDINPPVTGPNGVPYTGNTKIPPPSNLGDVSAYRTEYFFPNAGDLIGDKDPYDPNYENGSRKDQAGYPMTNRTLTAERYTERDYGLNKNYKKNLTNIVIFLLQNENYKHYKVVFRATASKLFKEKTNSKLPPYEKLVQEQSYNLDLSKGRLFSGVDDFFKILEAQGGNKNVIETLELIKQSDGSATAGVTGSKLENVSEKPVKLERKIEIFLEKNTLSDIEIKKENDIIVNTVNLLRTKNASTYDCFKFGDNKLSASDKFPIGFEKARKIESVFHSQTPEDFHRRLTFLQQCTRPGRSLDNKVSASNAIFGRQPICVLRLGDFMHSKVIVHAIEIDYSESPWDQNPEGMGMQPMVASVSMNLTLIGGQSLETPIDQIQTALDFNFYGNSTVYNTGVYEKATKRQTEQLIYQRHNFKK